MAMYEVTVKARITLEADTEEEATIEAKGLLEALTDADMVEAETVQGALNCPSLP